MELKVFRSCSMKPFVTKPAHISTPTHTNQTPMVPAEQLEPAQPMEDEASILRKMRRLTDYYDIHKEIGR